MDIQDLSITGVIIYGLTNILHYLTNTIDIDDPYPQLQTQQDTLFTLLQSL